MPKQRGETMTNHRLPTLLSPSGAFAVYRARLVRYAWVTVATACILSAVFAIVKATMLIGLVVSGLTALGIVLTVVIASRLVLPRVAALSVVTQLLVRLLRQLLPKGFLS